MLKSVKNIRNLDNINILFLSSDENIRSVAICEDNDYFQKTRVVKSANETLLLIKEHKFDILLIDTQMIDLSFGQFCETLIELKLSIPKIIISDQDTNENIMLAINCDAYTFLSKPFKEKDLKLAIMMCINQTKRSDKIEFQHGIYFDIYRDQFYKKNGVLIEFTRLEKSLIRLLVEKGDEITDYDTIKKVIWKDKNMSIYTMRNFINKIRQKTYYAIIENRSNKGYVIDISKN